MQDVTGRSQFSRNLLVYWTTQIVVIVVGFLIPRQISDHLGSSALGTWDLGWATYRYLTLAGIGAVGVSRYTAMHRAAEDHRALSQVYSISTILQAMMSLVVLILAILLVGSGSMQGIEDVDPVEVRTLILLFCLSIVVRLLGDPSRGVITGAHRWDLHHTINAAQDTLLAAALVIGLNLGAGLIQLGLIVFASSLFTTVSRLIVMSRICPEVHFSVSLWKPDIAGKLLRFGLKSMANASSQLILIQTVSITLALFAGPAALAIYSRTYTLVRLAEHFLTKVSNIFTPMASSLIGLDRREEAEKMLVESCTFFMAAALAFSTGLYFFGDLVVNLWMGQEYADSQLVRILAIGCLLPIANTGPFSILAGLNAHGKVGIASLFTTVVGLSALIPLIDYFYEINYLSSAFILGTVWTAARGIPLPILLKYQFGISPGTYLISAILKPALFSIPLVFFCYLSREEILQSNYLLALVHLGMAVFITAGIYWLFLLPPNIRIMLVRKWNKDA